MVFAQALVIKGKDHRKILWEAEDAYEKKSSAAVGKQTHEPNLIYFLF